METKTRIYNILNLISIVGLILSTIFIFYSIFSLGNPLIFVLVVLFYPLFLSIIGFNRKSFKKSLININKLHYEANGLNVDNDKDLSSSLTDEELELLPFLDEYHPKFINSNRKRYLGLETNKNFNRIFYSEMEGSGIKYSIDDFKHLISAKYKEKNNKGHWENKSNTLFSFSGNALRVEFENFKFGSNPITFINKPFKESISKVKIKSPEKKTLSFNEEENIKTIGSLFFEGDEDKIDSLNMIEEVIQKCKNMFTSKNKFFMILQNNSLILLTNNDKFSGEKIPLFIFGSKLDDITSDRKKQIYKFNMFLNDISTIFYN